MDNLIQSLASEAQGKDENNTPNQGQNLLSSLLGGLTSQDPSQQTQSGNALGLLGGLLGGGGSGGLLGSLLGGGQGGANPLVDNIAAQLSQKLGIDSAIAKLVVTFAISKLLPMIAGALTGQAAQATAPAPSVAPAPQQSSSGLGGLLQMVMGNKTVTSAYLRSNGLTQELSQQAGIDPRTADKSLKQTFKLLGEQMAGDEGMSALAQLLGQ